MNFSQRVAHSTKKDPNQYFSIIKTDPFRARLNTWLAHSKTRFTAFCLANRRSSKSLNILEFQRKPVKKRTSGIDRKSSKMELMGGVEPPTASLRMRCSAIKLHQQIIYSAIKHLSEERSRRRSRFPALRQRRMVPGEPYISLYYTVANEMLCGITEYNRAAGIFQ